MGQKPQLKLNRRIVMEYMHIEVVLLSEPTYYMYGLDKVNYRVDDHVLSLINNVVKRGVTHC